MGRYLLIPALLLLAPNLVLGEDGPSAARTAEERIARAERAFQPEKTGDEMLDGLLLLWSRFAFDTARDAVRSLSKTGDGKGKASSAGLSLPRPETTGDSTLDTLVREWWDLSHEMTTRLRGILNENLEASSEKKR